MNIRKSFEKIIKKIKERNILFLYIAAGAMIFIASAVLGFFLFKKMTYKVVAEEFKLVLDQKKEENPCEVRRFYDGVCDESGYEKRLTAVMIENHTDARPQSGLAGAAVVYEAPVEANFTRFMALYPLDAKVDKIGPVRSARLYYLDWLREFGKPMYMHVGGSPQALSEIGEGGIFDINEFSYGWYFWRDSARYAPHNAYTSSKLFQAAWEKYGGDETPTTSSWQYADGVACAKDCVDQIKIIFSLPSYVVRWNYNTSTNQFDRYQTEGRHTDTGGKSIFADTVIVQRVTSKVIDEVGRKDIETIGKGEAIIFANGIATKGVWTKSAIKNKTEWLTEDGTPIPLKPGKIWVEVVGQDSDADFTLE